MRDDNASVTIGCNRVCAEVRGRDEEIVRLRGLLGAAEARRQEYEALRRAVAALLDAVRQEEIVSAWVAVGSAMVPFEEAEEVLADATLLCDQRDPFALRWVTAEDLVQHLGAGLVARRVQVQRGPTIEVTRVRTTPPAGSGVIEGHVAGYGAAITIEVFPQEIVRLIPGERGGR